MRVNVREILEKTVEVESIEEAKQQYANCKIMLLPEDLVSVEFSECEDS